MSLPVGVIVPEPVRFLAVSRDGTRRFLGEVEAHRPRKLPNRNAYVIKVYLRATQAATATYLVHVVVSPEVAEALDPQVLGLPQGTPNAIGILAQARVGDFLDSPDAEALTRDKPATIDTFSSYFLTLRESDPATDLEIRRYLRVKTYAAKRLGLPAATFSLPDQLRFHRPIGEWVIFAEEERDELWTFWGDPLSDGFHLTATSKLLRVIRDEAKADAVGPASFARRKVRKGAVSRIFLSHASSDRVLARRIKQALEEAKPGLEVWVSSAPGQIEAGSVWFNDILANLARADAYLLLLTPEAQKRPWFWFEGGLAYSTEHPFVIARAGGLLPSDVLSPYSELQTLSFEDTEELIDGLNRFGIELPDPEALSRLLSPQPPAATPAPALSHQAKVLLWHASKLEGRILRYPSTFGQIPVVSANGRRWPAVDDSREQARWRGAIDELVSLGYANQRSRDQFYLTESGYLAAEATGEQPDE